MLTALAAALLAPQPPAGSPVAGAGPISAIRRPSDASGRVGGLTAPLRGNQLIHYGGVPVPYTVAWTGEDDGSFIGVCPHSRRDAIRVRQARGVCKPRFGRPHMDRQREAIAMGLCDLCPEPPSLRDLSIPALTHLRDQVVAELATRRARTTAEVVRLYPSNDSRYHWVGRPYRREDGALVVDCVARSPYEATGDREDER